MHQPCGRLSVAVDPKLAALQEVHARNPQMCTVDIALPCSRTCCGDSVNWYRRTSPPACPTATMPEKGHTWHGRGSRNRGQSYVRQSAKL